ncbi:MAG: hypothetical protein ACHQXL_10095 [Candidatus Limnocylindrales bacterium]
MSTKRNGKARTGPAPGRWLRGVGLLAAGLLLAACSGDAVATPPISPGTADRPRDVNIITKDYSFLPPIVDLVRGETVLLHVINGGLEVHEVVIGDPSVQDAWEAAEAAAANPPPGPTPVVVVPQELAGVRIVVQSGQRVDLQWTVPLDPGPILIGCHIAGHWAKGMQAAIRLVPPGALAPGLRSAPPSPAATQPPTGPASSGDQP